MSPPRPHLLDTSILFDVFALNQAVSRMLAAAMRDGPLSPGEYAVYSAIFELEAATPTQLAARLGMRLTTFMDQLRVIRGRGHARRIDNPRDGRSYRVVLTASGLEAHRAAGRQFEDAYQAFVRRLPAGIEAAREGLAVIRLAAEAVSGEDRGWAAARSWRTDEAVSPRRSAGRGG